MGKTGKRAQEKKVDQKESRRSGTFLYTREIYACGALALRLRLFWGSGSRD